MCDWIMRDFLRELILTDEQLHAVHNRFCIEFCKGLGARSNANADIKCYITYVQDLPTRNETGRFLALDLGGATFRVIMIQLRGNSMMQTVSESYNLSEKIMTGTGAQLFDYIATCLNDFVVKYGVEKSRLPLAFTFAFPCMQVGLTKALLVRWTKGFNCSGVVHKDVGRMLKEAIGKYKQLKIDVVAVLNNTTGTLVSCAHSHPTCRIGLIVSTGCNACYVENVANVERLETQYKDKPNVIINTEWGAFGEKGTLEIVRTDFDQTLDRNSINKGKQLFEKMVSGMYLGTLVRFVFLRAVHENMLFNGTDYGSRIRHILTYTQNALETNVLFDVDNDTEPDYAYIRKYFRDTFQITDATKQDCERFKMICDVVARRSGLLIGTGLAAIVNRIGLPEVTVGASGLVYQNHRSYDGYIRQAMDKLVKPQYKYNITLSEDGAGRGAALVAAVVSPQSNKVAGFFDDTLPSAFSGNLRKQ